MNPRSKFNPETADRWVAQVKANKAIEKQKRMTKKMSIKPDDLKLIGGAEPTAIKPKDRDRCPYCHARHKHWPGCPKADKKKCDFCGSVGRHYSNCQLQFLNHAEVNT